MIVGAIGAIVTVEACCALGAVPFVAWMAKAKEPLVVGVPLKTPLVAFNARPPGNVPEATVQVIGVVPVAVKV